MDLYVLAEGWYHSALIGKTIPLGFPPLDGWLVSLSLTMSFPLNYSTFCSSQKLFLLPKNKFYINKSYKEIISSIELALN